MCLSNGDGKEDNQAGVSVVPAAVAAVVFVDIVILLSVCWW